MPSWRALASSALARWALASGALTIGALASGALASWALASWAPGLQLIVHLVQELAVRVSEASGGGKVSRVLNISVRKQLMSVRRHLMLLVLLVLFKRLNKQLYSLFGIEAFVNECAKALIRKIK